MRTFPFKRSGEQLEAKHVNDLGDAVNECCGTMPGSYLMGYGSAKAGLFPGSIRKFIVTTVTNDEPKGRPMYWDTEASSPGWADNTDENEFDIDGSDVDLEVGDELVAFWDPQRNAYVPMSGGGTKIIAGTLDDVLTPGNSVDVTSENGVPYENVQDWINFGSGSFAAGTRCFFTKFGSSSYRFIDISCTGYTA